MNWPQKNTAAVAKAMAGQEDHKEDQFDSLFLRSLRSFAANAFLGPVFKDA
jgi:hypothetical protein